nr:copia protein [Tanacetum cinerariifolium]
MGLRGCERTLLVQSLREQSQMYSSQRHHQGSRRSFEDILVSWDGYQLEVILNGDSPAPTRVVEGVVQSVAHITAEQRLARKNKLKARGTLLMTLPDKHQLKFNIHKDTKTLMEVIEKRFGGNKKTKKRTHTLIWRNKTDLEEQSLNDLFNSLKIYEAELSAISAKLPVFALPNVDTLSNAIDADDLEEIDLKWQMAMLTWSATTAIGKGTLQESCDGVGSYDWSFQAEEEPTNYALMAFSSPSSSSSGNKVVFCSKSCTKAYATLQSHYDKLTNELRKSQFDVLSYQTRLESKEARLLVYQQNETVFEENIKLLKLDIELRDKALAVLRQKFESAKIERDDLKLKLEKFQTSSKNLRDGYHAVPPLYRGTFMLPKPNLVFNNAPTANETDHTVFNVKLIPTKPDTYLSHNHRPSAPIIEDWVSNSEDESQHENPQNVSSFVQPTNQVKSPRPSTKLSQAKTAVTKPYSPPRRHINRRPSPKASTFPPKVIATKAPIVNAVREDMLPLVEIQMVVRSLKKMCDKKNNVLFTDTKCIVLSSEFKLPDENHVLLRVPRENNMYNVDLKNIVPSGNLTCLFAKATLDESNLDAAFEEKEYEFEERKPESEVHVSSSSKFEDFFDNSINQVNAAELEDITYSDDEEDVGAEADFTNLETTITEEGIDYKEVFSPVARIEAIRLFLAYASFMGFMVYQMDVKSAFLYETIKEEVYVCQPPGFEDPDYPDKVYKVVKALYGLHQAPRTCQEKYKAEILRKFGLTDEKSASTPMDTEKPFLKDPDVKRIFRYLKGKLHLGLWYPKDSPFNLVAYSDSDYAVASLDRKSTTEGCQFLGCRLISWQCKKQIVIATSSTEAELILLLLVQKFLLFGLTNWCCSLSAVRSQKGVECLLNEEIFTELARMGVGKGIYGVDTPFFKGMLVAQEVDEGADDVNVEDVPTAGVATEVQLTPPQSPEAQPPSPQQQPQPSQDVEISMDLLHTLLETCTTLTRKVENLEKDKIAQALEITKLKHRVKKLKRRNKMKVLKLRRLKKVGTAQRIDTSDDTIMDDVSKHGGIIANINADEDVVLEDAKDVVVEKSTDVEESADVLSMQEEESEPAELQEVVDVVTTAKIMTKVVIAASTTITATDALIPAATIIAAPSTLTTAPSAARRRKRVVIRDPEETATQSTIIHSEAKSKDKGKWILDKVSDHVHKKAKEDNVVKRYQALKRKPQTKAQAIKNMMIYLKNVVGFKMDYFKGMSYDDIHPIFENKFNSNVAFLQKTKEQMDEEDSRALKRINESQEDKATKRPYYKIKRADGSHQLYLSFLSMLRNFEREDLEALWRLVKERFATTKPKNFSDDFLLTTLGAMFEKPDEEEHLAPADSSDVPVVDHVLPAGDTEALEADESTHAPGSPIIIPLS